MARFRVTLLAALAACASTPRPAAAPAPYADPAPHRALRIAVAPGVRLEVLDFGGSGPPLVFLAGMRNTAHSFDTFAPRFTDRFHVLALTRRGLGASDRPAAGPYDAATLAADVKAVLDSLAIARAVIVGHSYGGTEASGFAATYPERVERIVYLDSCGGCAQSAGGGHPLAPPAPKPASRDTLTPGGMAAYQRRTLGFSLPEAELRAINAYSSGTVRDPVPASVWRALAAGSGHPDFARITAPALAIFADRSTPGEEFWWYARMNPAEKVLARLYVDTELPYRRASRDQLARELPAVRVETIAGAHHFIFLSHPDQTERLIRAFLLAPVGTTR